MVRRWSRCFSSWAMISSQRGEYSTVVSRSVEFRRVGVVIIFCTEAENLGRATRWWNVLPSRAAAEQIRYEYCGVTTRKCHLPASCSRENAAISQLRAVDVQSEESIPQVKSPISRCCCIRACASDSERPCAPKRSVTQRRSGAVLQNTIGSHRLYYFTIIYPSLPREGLGRWISRVMTPAGYS